MPSRTDVRGEELPNETTRKETGCTKWSGERSSDADTRNKVKQRKYKDNRKYVKPNNMKPGDLALLSQKQTKRNPPYEPRPYGITAVRGHQITGQRNEKQETRDIVRNGRNLGRVELTKKQQGRNDQRPTMKF